jgi:hypothetical protein
MSERIEQHVCIKLCEKIGWTANKTNQLVEVAFEAAAVNQA